MVTTEDELEAELCQRLQATAKQLRQVFEIEQQADDSFIIRLQSEHLDRDAWMTVNDYVQEKGGEWDEESKQWTVPYKEEPKKALEKKAPEKKPKATEETEKEYDLQQSRQKLGELIPILTDAHGNIIDGFHRQEIDPDWKRVKAEHVTDPVQLAMARLAANVCRRQVPAEEKMRLLGNIAELTGWNAEQIADALGMSYRWVMKYLPEQFKREYSTVEKVHGVQILHESVKVPEAHEESDEEHLTIEETEAPTIHEEPAASSSEPTPQIHKESEEPFEAQSITPTVPTETVNTDIIITCPECNRKFRLIHIKPSGAHKLEEIKH